MDSRKRRTEKTGDSRRAKQARERLLVGLSVMAASALPGAKAIAQSITCFQSLNFGSLVACTGAGTAKVDTSGGLTTTGCTQAVGGVSLQGRCLLTGSFFPVKAMVITIPAATYTVATGANHMNVKSFHLDSAGHGRTVTKTAFITIVDVGATLHVGANQAVGSYSGTVTVNVSYQ